MSEEHSFLDYALDEVPELEAVPGDQEYQLEIVKIESKVSKGEKTAGQPLLLVLLKILDQQNAQLVTHPIMLPSEQVDQEDNDNRKRGLKRFLQAFGWDVSKGFNPSELIGLTGFAILKKETSAEYGDQNKVKSWVVPK